jgi:acetyltransferase EpsM
MKDKVLIWGASGHAKVVAEIIRLNDEFDIVGFYDNVNKAKEGTSFCDSTIYSKDSALAEFLDKGVNYIIIGFGSCQARLSAADFSRQLGYQLATAIHPKSIIADNAQIHQGTVICAGATIVTESIIGECAIINTGASIDHECHIGNGVHVSPGAHLAGNVTIGEATWIGIGSSVIEGITIGNNSVIGAGSVVVKDIPEHVVAYGNPAKIIHAHE